MAHSVMLQPLEAHHADVVADIHILSQEGTFLTSLGDEFLRVLYQQFSRSDYAICYVALDGDEPIGFIVGTLDTNAIFKEVAVKRFLELSWLVLKRAISKPTLLWQAIRTLTYPAQASNEGPEAELLALALKPAWRKKHIGGRLTTKLIESMKIAGVEKMVVTVDGNNDGAIRFYKRHGFEHSADFEMYGRPMVNLIIDLVNESEAKGD